MTFTSTIVCTYQMTTRAFSESLSKSWRHCVHVMIHSSVQNDCFLFQNKVEQTAMMQMRFDGRLGFPGGFVDPEDESLEAGLNREIREEMGNLPKNFEITANDYLTAYLFEEKKYCLHFYAKEVTFKDYLEIESRQNPQLLRDFEVLGVVRVPLYTMSDNRGGFPAFLRNNFIGHSREQLLYAIRTKKLLSEEKLLEYLEFSKLPDNMSSTLNEVESPSL